MDDVKIETTEATEVEATEVETDEVTEVETIETAEQRAKRHIDNLQDFCETENINLYSYISDSTKKFSMAKIGLSFGKPIDDASMLDLNSRLAEFVQLFKGYDDVFIECDANDKMSKTKYAISELVAYPSSPYGSEYDGYRRCFIGIDSSKNSLNVRLVI